MSADIITNAIENIIQNNIVNIHTISIGKISKYDYKTHKADVKPVLKKRVAGGDIVDMPVISNVPVIIDRNADYIIHRPIKKGDYVLLLFCERSIDSWISKGGESAPLDKRKYHLNDAIAIPGIFPFLTKSLAEDNENFLLKFKNTELKFNKNGTIALKNAISSINLDNSGNVNIKNSVGNIDLKSNGEIALKNTIGTIKVDATGKIALGTPFAEVLQLFDLTLDALIADTIITPPTKILLTAVKALLLTIKGTV